MKTFKDLIMSVEFNNVVEYLLEPDLVEKYRHMFNRLREIEPKIDENMTIVVYKQQFDDHFTFDVYGVKSNEPGHWAIEYCSWPEWLGMKISEDTLSKMEPAEIVAFCLWEMSWSGYTEEENERKNRELDEIIQQSIETWEYDRSQFRSWDDVKKELEELYPDIFEDDDEKLSE